MNARDRNTVLQALQGARALLQEDRKIHFDSNVSKASGKLPPVEQKRLNEYDRALKKIDQSLVIVDSSAAIRKFLDRGCLGDPAAQQRSRERG